MNLFNHNRLEQTTAPTEWPVDVDECKAHMRLPSNLTSQDGMIQVLIETATGWAEDYSGRQFMNATWEATWNHFPAFLNLPQPPFSSLTTFTYVDTTGTTTSVSSSIYQIVSDKNRAHIQEAYDQSWPSARPQSEAIKVTWVAGYGAVGRAVPAKFRQAILILVSTLYEQPDLVVTGMTAGEVPFSAKQLLGTDRIYAGV